MTYLPDWAEALLISGIYLAVLAGTEVFFLLKKPAVELTRKFAHLVAGLVCVSFSYVFESHWYVLGMVTAFVLLMIVTRKTGLLKSIHSVDRSSKGSVYFPLAVYGVFVLSSVYEVPHFYVISILVLAIADTLAALIGVAYGQTKYQVETREIKSIEGSIVFFLATFIITHLGLLLLSDIGRVESVLCALLVAILVSVFESISLGGADNLFIPLGTWLTLMKCVTEPAGDIARDIVLVGVILLITYAVGGWPQKRLGTSAVMGVTLLGYGAWSLVGFNWFLVVLTGVILFCHTRLFFESTPHSRDLFRVRPVFYIGILPFVWILFANLQDEWRPLFLLPFVVSVASQLSISWRNNSRFHADRLRERYPKLLVQSSPLVRSLVIMMLFVPVQFMFESGMPAFYTVVAAFLGLFVIDFLYWFIGRRFKKRWIEEKDRVNYFRLSLLLRSGVTLVILLGNLSWYFEWL